jgi:hypothetical protein
MEAFAKDTRHREHQLDEVPLKLVCTQLPSFIDYRHVYPFIADDLNAINFRAPGVLDSYANVRHISPKLLEELLSSPENLKVAQKVPLFNDFVEKVQPPKGKEIVTFFAHRKNLLDHVESITTDFDERKRLFKAISGYQIPKNTDMRQAAISIGHMLNEFKIGEHTPEEVIEAEPVKEPVEDEVEEFNLTINDPVPLVDEEYWENPVLKAFKIDAGLSTRFSTDKTVKQILVRACAPNMVDKLELGKHQKEVPQVESTFEHFPVSYIDHLPTETISSMLPYCSDLYHGLIVKPKEGRELVKTLFMSQNPSLKKFIQVSKNYTPNNMDEVITLLLGASSCSPLA